ncbi:hypothetical protein [Streptomyces sp. KL116D]|uniref:hypothetical protein n=1 Tax=Streptomyces sp. KL116D TaxID=3045152 RepID=UPI003555F3B1
MTVEQGDTDDELVLRSRFGTERISAPTPVVREALRRMQLGPVLLANISTGRLPADRTGGGPGRVHLVLWPMLRRLSHLIVRTLSLEDLKGPLLSVITTRQGAGFTPVGVSAQRLSPADERRVDDPGVGGPRAAVRRVGALGAAAQAGGRLGRRPAGLAGHPVPGRGDPCRCRRR